MKKDERISGVIYSNEEIIEKIEACAKWLNSQFKNKNVLLIGMLKGCIPFVGHLLPKLEFDVTLDFFELTKYDDKKRKLAEPIFKKGLVQSVKDANIILIDDIFYSGKTLDLAKKLLKKEGAKSITTVTLIKKEYKRKPATEVDYACIELKEQWVVGWGLDYNEEFRDLPYLASLIEKEE